VRETEGKGGGGEVVSNTWDNENLPSPCIVETIKPSEVFLKELCAYYNTR
jgi:hypothetical protein